MIPRVSHALRLLLLCGLLGTGAELLLLGHTEGAWQLVPLILLVLMFTGVLWYSGRPSTTSRRAARSTMGLCAASGVAGVLLHYRANIAFERELDPSLTGPALVRQAMTGAMPVLAPGAMLLLGCLGLIWASMHKPLTSTG